LGSAAAVGEGVVDNPCSSKLIGTVVNPCWLNVTGALVINPESPKLIEVMAAPVGVGAAKVLVR
jgi:hypothetical protein